MAADLSLVPFGTATLTMAEPLVLTGGPRGTRLIVDLLEGRFEGRLAGVLRGRAAGDWVLIGPDGSAALDVRLTIATDDGALVWVQCVGRVHLGGGAAQADALLIATFETGDERYSWLNIAVVMIRARTTGNRLDYTLFEVAR